MTTVPPKTNVLLALGWFNITSGCHSELPCVSVGTLEADPQKDWLPFVSLQTYRKPAQPQIRWLIEKKAGRNGGCSSNLVSGALESPTWRLSKTRGIGGGTDVGVAVLFFLISGHSTHIASGAFSGSGFGLSGEPLLGLGKTKGFEGKPQSDTFIRDHLGIL